MVVLKPYNPQCDAILVYRLWQRTLGHIWPLPYEIFQSVTIGDPIHHHFVAVSDNEIIGFVATRMRRERAMLLGELLILLVDPAHQRRGIGRMLHNYSLAALKQQGVAKIRLGGSLPHFWQGIPTNLPGAWLFFQTLGWTEQEHSYDLIRELVDYHTPVHIYAQIYRSAITIVPAVSTDRQAILDFEKCHFPQWFPYYKRLVSYNHSHDIVVARDSLQSIIGISSAIDSSTPRWQEYIKWSSLLGESTGGIGPLGVAEPLHKQGAGLALAARVTEKLQERGLVKSYIGWTWLVEWYSKLGYEVWQEYIMSWRED